MREEQKFVDQLDYRQLCVEKQREIDRLQGMLEQRSGLLRRMFAKTPRIFKSWVFYVVVGGLSVIGVCAVGLYRCDKRIAIVADQPAVSIVQMIQYDGYHVEYPMHLKFGKRTVIALLNKDTDEYVYLPIDEETHEYFEARFNGYKKHPPLDVVDMTGWIERCREQKALRQQELEKIRSKYNYPTSGAVDGF